MKWADQSGMQLEEVVLIDDLMDDAVVFVQHVVSPLGASRPPADEDEIGDPAERDPRKWTTRSETPLNSMREQA